MKKRPGPEGRQLVPGEGRQEDGKLGEGVNCQGSVRARGREKASPYSNWESFLVTQGEGPVAENQREMMTSVPLAVPGPKVRGGAVTGI